MKYIVHHQKMALNVRQVGIVLLLVCLLLFYCEVLIYYVVLWKCRYPVLTETRKLVEETPPPKSPPGSENPLNQQKPQPKEQHEAPQQQQQQHEVLHAMFLADTHLLGSRLGHWLDKLRREWQMHRSFVTAYQYFEPDAVFFLGDLFDEAKWCGRAEFEYYVARFRSLFPVPPTAETAVVTVAGNHDIGFHYATHPQLVDRFEAAFANSTGVSSLTIKGVKFVTVNSVAMEGDGCFLCSKAVQQLDKIQQELKCPKDADDDAAAGRMVPPAADGPDGSESYSTCRGQTRPILLQHYPLFRKSDESCEEDGEPDAADPAEERSKEMKEAWDCLSEKSTELLLTKLEPRFVLSGHTHNGCRKLHRIRQQKSTVDPNIEPWMSYPDQAPSYLFEGAEEDEGRDEDGDGLGGGLWRSYLEVEEWSVASFSWRNQQHPNFVLARITGDTIALRKCYLPKEATVFRVYALGSFLILIYAYVTRRKFFRRF